MVRRDRKPRLAALRILLALGLVSITSWIASGQRRLTSGPDGTTALEKVIERCGR